MKRISLTSKGKDKVLQVKTDLGTIGIMVGLKNEQGNKIETITFIPREIDRINKPEDPRVHVMSKKIDDEWAFVGIWEEKS